VADACCVTYRTGVTPHTGLSARIELEVTEADTAEAFHSGTVPVLATPRLIALCEEASCNAIDGSLDERCTSVAKRLQFDHLAPVGVGGTVWAEATLDRIEGRRLVFTLSVSESAGLVAAGKLIRVIVDRETFLTNVR
jgi:predicted thioesterase